MIVGYGTSGTGKSYTMSGNETGGQRHFGLVQRIIREVLVKMDHLNNPSDSDSEADESQDSSESLPFPSNGKRERAKYLMFVHNYEIWKEQIFDLLRDYSADLSDHEPLKLQEKKKGHPYVRDLSEIAIKDFSHALDLISKSRKNRQVSETLLNQESSRSHGIFTIKLVKVPEINTTHQISSKEVKSLMKVSSITIVDLAGSERITRSGADLEQMREASRINTSLLTFSRCIQILKQNQELKTARLSLAPSNGTSAASLGATPGTNGREQIVPFRESNLTRLLSKFFMGEGVVSMIICTSPSSSDYDETINALRFGNIAKAVQTSSSNIVAGRASTFGAYPNLATGGRKRTAQEAFDSEQTASQTLVTLSTPSNCRPANKTSRLQTASASAKVTTTPRTPGPTFASASGLLQVQEMKQQIESFKSQLFQAESRHRNLEQELRLQIAKEVESIVMDMESEFQSQLDSHSQLQQHTFSQKLGLLHDNSDVVFFPSSAEGINEEHVDFLRSKLARVESELAKMIAISDSLEARMQIAATDQAEKKKLIDDLTIRSSSFELEREELMHQIEILRNQLSAVQVRHSNHSVVNDAEEKSLELFVKASQIEELKGQIRTLQNENTRLQNMLSQSEHSHGHSYSLNKSVKKILSPITKTKEGKSNHSNSSSNNNNTSSSSKLRHNGADISQRINSGTTLNAIVQPSFTKTGVSVHFTSIQKTEPFSSSSQDYFSSPRSPLALRNNIQDSSSHQAHSSPPFEIVSPSRISGQPSIVVFSQAEEEETHYQQGKEEKEHQKQETDTKEDVEEDEEDDDYDESDDGQEEGEHAAFVKASSPKETRLTKIANNSSRALLSNRLAEEQVKPDSNEMEDANQCTPTKKSKKATKSSSRSKLVKEEKEKKKANDKKALSAEKRSDSTDVPSRKAKKAADHNDHVGDEQIKSKSEGILTRDENCEVSYSKSTKSSSHKTTSKKGTALTPAKSSCSSKTNTAASETKSIPPGLMSPGSSAVAMDPKENSPISMKSILSPVSNVLSLLSVQNKYSHTLSLSRSPISLTQSKKSKAVSQLSMPTTTPVSKRTRSRLTKVSRN